MRQTAGSRGISAVRFGLELGRVRQSDSAHATQGLPVPSAKGIAQTGIPSTRSHPKTGGHPMSHHIIQPLGPQALEMQAEVLLWFAAGHDVLWIPIVEVGDEPDAIARARAEAEDRASGVATREMATADDARLWITLGGAAIWEV